MDFLLFKIDKLTSSTYSKRTFQKKGEMMQILDNGIKTQLLPNDIIYWVGINDGLGYLAVTRDNRPLTTNERKNEKNQISPKTVLWEVRRWIGFISALLPELNIIETNESTEYNPIWIVTNTP